MSNDEMVETEKMNAVVTLKVGVGLAQRAGRSMMSVPTGKMAEIAEAFESATEALAAVVESAVTDEDTCAICLCPLDRHASGCSVAWAAAALAKARGES